MGRDVNAELIKRLRKEQGWSQEELAIAASLSARTIQRIEADGSGSVNSIKSIASALEVDMHNLEDLPRTKLVGVRWGYAGLIIGTTLGAGGAMADWIFGDGTAAQTGISLGIIGALAGLSAAYIGRVSDRQR